VFKGNLKKLTGTLQDPITYELPLGDDAIPLNPQLGNRLSLTFTGDINCTACGRKTKKSYSQGYCFPCSQNLAQCDICIVRPERCHFDQGTCREPEWAQSHCMQPHFVYLANTSGLKVGITRATQIPTRWIDQGAFQALPIFKVDSRYQSGLLETVLAAHINDKTNWRKMLKGDVAEIDLFEQRDELFNRCNEEISTLIRQFGESAITFLREREQVALNYPVLEHPEKIASLNLDKTAQITGTLLGIKGQYLILDTGVLNIRKFTGYHVELHTE
jgi:hypothetical protein